MARIERLADVLRFLHRALEHDYPGVGTTNRYGSFADGSRNTIHASGDLSVEVDAEGRPTAVWFRCLLLPFHTWERSSGEPLHCNPDDMVILNIEYERTGDAQT